MRAEAMALPDEVDRIAHRRILRHGLAKASGWLRKDAYNVGSNGIVFLDGMALVGIYHHRAGTGDLALGDLDGNRTALRSRQGRDGARKAGVDRC